MMLDFLKRSAKKYSDQLTHFVRLWTQLEKYTKYALILVFIGFLIRLSLSIYTSVSGDACWHLSVARHIARTGSIPLFEPLGRDVFWPPPLFHILNGISYLSLNWLVGEASLKLIVPIFGALFLWYAFLIVRKLFDSRTAFYSTVFLFAIPVLIYQSAIGYVDIAFGFFTLATIYYALEKRLVLSAVLSGLALLTKTNAFFIIPILLYTIFVVYPEKNTRIRRVFIFLAIAFIIGSVWYIRDWLLLGNPVWPFMNNIFHGYASSSVPNQTFNFGITNVASTFYLSLFGIPNGNAQNLSLVGNGWLIAGWIATTAVFISFFFIGIYHFIKNRSRAKGFNIINLLFISLFFFQIIMITNIGDFQTRYIMPALLFFSVYWSIGLMSVMKMKHAKAVALIIVAFSAVVFITGEFFKAYKANSMWNYYSDDFEWIKGNIPENATILTPNSQCYSYKFDRRAESIMFVETGFYSYKDIDYIFYPERSQQSYIVSTYDNMPTILNKSVMTYENNATGIAIYQVAN